MTSWRMYIFDIDVHVENLFVSRVSYLWKVHCSALLFSLSRRKFLVLSVSLARVILV